MPRLDPDPEPQGQELHLSINLPNEVALRSESLDPMKVIERLRLVFYDKGQSPCAQEVREIPISDIDQLDGLTVQLPISDYQLVAIANPSSAMRGITRKGSPLSLILDGQEWRSKDFMQVERSNGDKCSAISMLNEQGLIDIPSSSFEQPQSHIQVNIEPSLARLYVFGEPELIGGEKGHATPSYTIAGTQVKTFPMRNMAKHSTGEMEQAGDKSSRTTRYATSPLWSQWSNGIPEKTDNFIQHRSGLSAALKKDIWGPVRKDKAHASQDLTEASLYIKEATLPENTFTQGTTPCVIIRYPYIPQSIAPLEAGEGFVKHQGRLYKENDIRSMLAGTLETPANLAQALKDHNIQTGSLNQPFDKGDLQFYKDAYSYYVIYIRHFSDRESNSTYGRYGLVRGNEYSIKITSILDTGLALPPSLSNNHQPISEYQSSKTRIIVADIIQREIQETQL